MQTKPNISFFFILLSLTFTSCSGFRDLKSSSQVKQDERLHSFVYGYECICQYKYDTGSIRGTTQVILNGHSVTDIQKNCAKVSVGIESYQVNSCKPLVYESKSTIKEANIGHLSTVKKAIADVKIAQKNLNEVSSRSESKVKKSTIKSRSKEFEEALNRLYIILDADWLKKP
jgi:hypothetical protein